VHSLCMRKDALVQLSLAIVGLPLIYLIWSPDAKWPNPWKAPKPPAT
jgi:hypothetical protein